jgi:hypothetical protein
MCYCINAGRQLVSATLALLCFSVPPEGPEVLGTEVAVGCGADDRCEDLCTLTL